MSRDDDRSRYPLLRPEQARSSLASRLSRVADMGSQVEVRMGLRPWLVFLVWTRWSGDERGDGRQTVLCRMPIQPVPRVLDLAAIARQPSAVGISPMGSVRVERISATYKRDVLAGRVVPDKPEERVPEPYEFFWEIVEDGRHGGGEQRMRFRLGSEPFLDAEQQQWVVNLERTNSDMSRTGRPIDDPPPDREPNRFREPGLPSLPGPVDDDEF